MVVIKHEVIVIIVDYIPNVIVPCLYIMNGDDNLSLTHYNQYFNHHYGSINTIRVTEKITGHFAN